GQREVEARALPLLGFDPDTAAVPFDDLLAQRQADPRAWIRFARVQALEDDKDALGILSVEADAVVRNGEQILRTVPLRADTHQRRRVATELDRVADQVLKDLAQLGWVAQQHRQRPDLNLRPRLIDRNAQIGAHLPQYGFAVHRLQSAGVRFDPRVLQQIVDQFLHTGRAVYRVTDELIGVAVEPAGVAPLQELRVAGDHPQRLLQVVAGDVGELLQSGIGAAEVLGHAAQILGLPPLGNVVQRDDRGLQATIFA